MENTCTPAMEAVRPPMVVLFHVSSTFRDVSNTSFNFISIPSLRTMTLAVSSTKVFIFHFDLFSFENSKWFISILPMLFPIQDYSRCPT